MVTPDNKKACSRITKCSIKIGGGVYPQNASCMYFVQFSDNRVRSKSSQQVRHIEDCRKRLIQDFIRQYVVSRGRKCLLCSTPVREIRAQNNSVILTKVSSGEKQGLHTIFLSPHEARNHLRKLMENDGRWLRIDFLLLFLALFRWLLYSNIIIIILSLFIFSCLFVCFYLSKFVSILCSSSQN